MEVLLLAEDWILTVSGGPWGTGLAPGPLVDTVTMDTPDTTLRSPSLTQVRDLPSCSIFATLICAVLYGCKVYVQIVSSRGR